MDEEPKPRFKTVMEYIAGVILLLLLINYHSKNTLMVGLYFAPKRMLVFLVVFLTPILLISAWLTKRQKRKK